MKNLLQITSMDKNLKKYHQAVNYLESITNLEQPDYLKKTSGRSLFLKRFNYFLKILGNPQQGLNYIHIGGTSGKGSTATMIQSILTEAGFKTGLFTSPFLTTSIEKIKIDDLLISPDEFTNLVEKLKPAVDKAYLTSPYGRPSYFEIFTALAFLYFRQKKCDWVVLEVGLGGRYDATNVIPPPKITVINLIGYDHVELLGKTLTKIATEKTGIIKPKTSFFTTAKNNKKVLAIFQKACKKNQAEFNIVGWPKTEYRLNLLGKHQQGNAALAAAVAKKLGINEAKIKAGLAKVKMPCRLEIIQKNPLIILDGAHNVSKIKTTVDFIRNLTYQKLYIIIALTKERNGSDIFKKIKLLANHSFVTRFQSIHHKCYPPKDLAKRINSRKPVEICLDPQIALNQALKIANKKDLILVTGSFYLAGELRTNWRSEEKILKERKV